MGAETESRRWSNISRKRKPGTGSHGGGGDEHPRSRRQPPRAGPPPPRLARRPGPRRRHVQAMAPSPGRHRVPPALPVPPLSPVYRDLLQHQP
ncbi:unnamed protein product [Urochloa humidicola]